MEYFPAFLNLKNRRCLVVGGGDIALRKARLLAAAGAHLTIVAAQIGDGMRDFAKDENAQLVHRNFQAADVKGHWLVVSATGNPQVERTVYRHAEKAGVFCNGVDDIDNCSYITPAIVDRGPIVIAISSGGSAPVLARKIREQIESLLPEGIARLATLARDWRERVRSQLKDLLSRRRYWEAIFDGPAATDAIAGNTAAAETRMREMLESMKADTKGKVLSGEAWLVGAGPGDPGLLTLHALQIMQKADVILYDRLVSPEILSLARRDADLLSVGKTPGCRTNSQEETNALLVRLVAAGKRVCRLKGGDPFIFGRGGEEAEALHAAGQKYTVVPGITAAAGCSAAAGIPLTHRDLSQSVAFVTAHGKDSVDTLDWASLARDRQTLAFYMAVKRFPVLMNNLIDNGRATETPIAIIEKGTTKAQRIVRGTLGQLTLLAAAHRIQAPAMLIVGEVAALGEHADADHSSGSETQRSPPISQPIYGLNYDKPDQQIQEQGQIK